MATRDQLASLVYCSKGKKENIDAYIQNGHDYSDGCLSDYYQKPTINISNFPNTFSNAFWSSFHKDYDENNHSAWYVNFDNGSYGLLDKSAGFAVRLVRVSR